MIQRTNELKIGDVMAITKLHDNDAIGYGLHVGQQVVVCEVNAFSLHNRPSVGIETEEGMRSMYNSQLQSVDQPVKVKGKKDKKKVKIKRLKAEIRLLKFELAHIVETLDSLIH